MTLGLFTCITDDSIFNSIIEDVSNQISCDTYFIVKDRLFESLESQKVLKNHLYAAKY
jgi:hypothetical protein